ncbi:MAG: dienelactone hydrolase family protein [Chloroflexi bacterium]|nr:dienelactone hydrolase family protein [Chloroflexota bacterium]
MPDEKLTVAVAADRTVTALMTQPEGESSGWRFVYAPGAGSNVHDPFGVHASQRLAAEGFSSVRFQFPYMEDGRRRPDRTSALEETWRMVIEAVRAPGLRLVVGGRSMGGRIASHVVAQGVEVDALALFAYPLRPPWRPEQLRDGHLADISVPTLFCSGTRDAFAAPDELRSASSRVVTSSVHLLEGADHGFSALKSSGRTRDDVWDEAIDAMLEWLRDV